MSELDANAGTRRSGDDPAALAHRAPAALAASLSAGGARAALTAFALAALAAAAVWGAAVPPRPLPVAAPPARFSAGRAMRDVRAIAAAPRPTGSEANARARAYLVARLERLGLAPQLQATTAASARYPVAGDVTNILARLPGTRAGGKAVLLMAHYDGVGAGPAAGDDAAGVAAVLETVRALRAGPPLRNDVIVLLTDGEEAGLLGAEAFARHPWARDVGVVLNLEARGTGGRSLMFETNEANAAVVRLFADAAPRPVASSFMYAVYRLLPNDTDFSVLRRLGLQGLNFGFIARPDRYHTPLDDAAHLDAGSLQDHGDAALALVRRLGNAELPLPRAGDVAFFSIPALGLVVYPLAWTTTLVGLFALLWLGAVGLGLARRRFRARSLVLGTLGVLLGIALAGAATLGAWLGLLRLHRHLDAGGQPSLSGVYAAGLAALGAAVFLAVRTPFRRWATPPAHLAGALVPWLALAALCAARLPAGTYLFVWPGIAAALALLLHVAAGPADAGDPAARRLRAAAAATAWIAGVLAILAVAPMAYLVFLGLSLQPPGAVAVPLLVALVLALLAFQLESLQATRPWTAPGAAALAAALLLAWGATTVRFGPETPRPSVAHYVLDADAGRAAWLAGASGGLDPWARALLGEAAVPARLPPALRADWVLAAWARRGQLFSATAPVLPLAPPTATLVADSAAPPGRVVRIRIASPRRGAALVVRVAGVVVHDASVAGLPLAGTGRRGWSFTYVNPPPAGFELRLALDGHGPARLHLIDEAAGLPAPRGRPVPPRPPGLAPFQTGDMTIVVRGYRL
ncbi:MAG: M28 family peptidase [Gemmatimonadetes bacterium]|nr:M28 family peptidase [Gemmatimonadota bacterium]